MPIAHVTARECRHYMRAAEAPRQGLAAWSALLCLMTWSVLNAIAKPDRNAPQCDKNAAQKEHRWHNCAGSNDEDLKQGAADQRDGKDAACESGEHHRSSCGNPASEPGRVRSKMVDVHGDRD